MLCSVKTRSYMQDLVDSVLPKKTQLYLNTVSQKLTLSHRHVILKREYLKATAGMQLETKSVRAHVES